MTNTDFNYYGFSKETFATCKNLIGQANRKNCLALTTWFLAVNLLYVVFSSFNLFGASQSNILFYTAFFVIAVLLVLLMLFWQSFCEKHSTLLVYTSIVINLAYGILVSVLQVYIPAIMFLLFLTLVGVTYIDKLYRAAFSMIVASMLFALSSFRFKTFSIAYYDTYNVIIVLVLAIGLHYMFQRLRIQQFVLFLKEAQTQRELEIKSSFDSLTGLMNRGRFFSFAEAAHKAHKDEYSALCIVDLDYFKEINDNYGHQIGDKVIQLTGRTILKTFGIPAVEDFDLSGWKPADTIPLAGRLGGDEFVVALFDMKHREKVMSLLETLLSNLNSIQIDGIQMNGIQASLGVTELQADETDIDSAYKRADDALYTSKRSGKNRISFV